MPSPSGRGSKPLSFFAAVRVPVCDGLFDDRPADVEEKEYEEFYKAITKDSQEPLGHIHFVAEGEVTFKSLLYVPKVQPSESFNKYGTRTDNIKVILPVRMCGLIFLTCFYY